MYCFISLNERKCWDCGPLMLSVVNERIFFSDYDVISML
jgi:hypothetical protein